MTINNELYLNRIAEMKEWLAELISATYKKFNEAHKEDIPEAPGIYVIKENDKMVYSGSAQNLRLRLWREHYLGEQPRKGGSQFRHVLNKIYPHLNDDIQMTDYVGKYCTFGYLIMDPIEKRELKFIEEFCHSIMRPDFIKFGAKDRVWGSSQKINYPIIYRCDDCGNEFPSGRRRSGLRLCHDCAEKRRSEGRGPVQLKKNVK